jgi:TonB family protein
LKPAHIRCTVSSRSPARPDDAKRVIERIVRADPFFRPQEGLVAPRIRAFFDDTRKPLLPVIARETYATAKAAYDKHDTARAAAGFDRVIAVIDDIGGTDPGLGDLRSVSVALRELARAASPAVGSPAAHAAGISAGVEPSWTIYDAQSANIVAPTPVSTPLPDWRPGFFELNRTFSGEVRLIIGEDGTVLSAEIATSVHARYDDRLLEAAKSWTFKPATKNGSPVTYRYLMPVRVLR